MKNANAAVSLATLMALSLLTLHARAQEFSERRLQQACEALERSPLSAGELQTLAEASRAATNSPALRSRAMAAYSLTFLMQLNTNAFDRALTVMRATCPDALQHVKVTQDDWLALCQECLGSGKQSTLCPTCMGSGKCKPCAGTGKREAERCAACKGKGECARCAGKKRITTPCPTCKGTAQVFKLKESIRANFSALVAEMAAICQENATYEERFKQASKEAELGARIALLRALIEAFPRRTDLGPALALLKQSLDAQKSEESRLQAREKREREERERVELLKLEEARSVKDLNAAIAALNPYLKAHPDCAAFVELTLLEEQLIARRNRAELVRKILYGVGALFGLLVLISVLKPLLFRPKPSGSTPLPGLDKIDKSQFTDPLKLTSQESRARVKTKTTEIPPPAE